MAITDDEQQIRTLVTEWATAVHTGDLEGVLADHRTVGGPSPTNTTRSPIRHPDVSVHFDQHAFQQTAFRRSVGDDVLVLDGGRAASNVPSLRFRHAPLP